MDAYTGVSMDWFMADPHFGHKNILGWEPGSRPYADTDEMDFAILKNINSLVKPTDTLYILGDVAFASKYDRLDHIVAQKIIIVLGNHDYMNKISTIIRPGVKVCGCLSYNGCILTHIPVHPNQVEERFIANIHGHLHGASIPDPRYICVSMEQWDMRPVDWPTLKRLLPK
jgi:calcineurin-like phosphoesterase family protein